MFCICVFFINISSILVNIRTCSGIHFNPLLVSGRDVLIPYRMQKAWVWVKSNSLEAYGKDWSKRAGVAVRQAHNSRRTLRGLYLELGRGRDSCSGVGKGASRHGVQARVRARPIRSNEPWYSPCRCIYWYTYHIYMCMHMCVYIKTHINIQTYYNTHICMYIHPYIYIYL